MTQITANGRTYSDDGSAALDMGNGGHRQNLLPMLGDVMTQTGIDKSAATAAADTATVKAESASASAAQAQNYAAALSATSTSAVTIATGSKAFLTQAGKQFTTGQWVTATSTVNPANWVYGQVTSYIGSTLIINATAIGGSGVTSDWSLSISGIQPPAAVGAVPLSRSTRTADTALATSDMGTLIDITSGTFTQTFAAATTLGAGWWCYLRNSGPGDITLDPSGSETIDGLTSFVMYPGECRLVQCDGATLTSIVINAFYRVFTTTETFIKPPGYRRFDGHLFGAGGSGSKCNALSSQAASGGGGGACAPFSLPSASVLQSQVVTIGAGGAPITPAGSDGRAGGSTSFNGITAYGGNGGVWSSNLLSNAYGGYAYTGAVKNDAIAPFVNGETAFLAGGSSTVSTYSQMSTPSIHGGGAGGACWGPSGVSASSSSVFAGNGGAASAVRNGEDGVAPAGGGGATIGGTQSGAGARGEARIWGVI